MISINQKQPSHTFVSLRPVGQNAASPAWAQLDQVLEVEEISLQTWMFFEPF
jgi:hypothetical protein